MGVIWTRAKAQRQGRTSSEISFNIIVWHLGMSLSRRIMPSMYKAPDLSPRIEKRFWKLIILWEGFCFYHDSVPNFLPYHTCLENVTKYGKQLFLGIELGSITNRTR